MPEIEFRQAVRDAIDEEMVRDPRVMLLGEDVGFAGGVFQATRGLHEKHGSERGLDTPISELALAGAPCGTAIAGLRPIIEIMFGDFMALAMDSIVNQSAKYWFLSNEQRSVPIVVRSAVGGGGRFGAIHSQNPASWFMSVPGLKIVAPSTPADAKGLLVAAIRDDNPVLFLEHKRLYAMKGEVGAEVARIGEAKVVREGTDLTIVTAMRGVHDSLRAAAGLEVQGISVEIVDLRTLRPLDPATILASVSKTRRLIVVDEGPHTGGWSAEVVALVAEQAGSKMPTMLRVTAPDIPLPCSPILEDSFLPGPDTITAAILAQLGEAQAAEARS